MNQIRQIQTLNKRELDSCVPPNASWHADYRHTAYIYIGGLPFNLSEGDLVTIFSQFGEPTYVKLARDKESGKSRGFGWLKYEDQRSCDLAVDNLGGAEVMGRLLRVDHAEYKKREGEEDDGGIDLTRVDEENVERKRSQEVTGTSGRRSREIENNEEERPVLREERELAKILRDHGDEDPMKDYLVQEKKDEVEKAIKRWRKEKKTSKTDNHNVHRSHRHKHSDYSSRHTRENGDKYHRHRPQKSRSPSSDVQNDRQRRRQRRRSRDDSLDSRIPYNNCDSNQRNPLASHGSR